MPPKSDAQNKDMYMQFFSITSALDGVNSQAVSEVSANTGLTLRGRVLWLIHQIEYEIEGQNEFAGAVHRVSLSRYAGLAALPTLDAPGLIDRAAFRQSDPSAGILSPVRRKLPPIPFAGPNLSVYAACSVNQAVFLGMPVWVRVGFTTAPLTRDMYDELAEVWGW